MTLRFATNRTSTAREITHDGRKYLVAPVVALVAGVVNGLYVPADELAAHVAAWNGRPISLNHPQADGQYISANSPDVWAQSVPGHLWNVVADGDKLKGDIWLDLEKAAKLGGAATEIVKRLRANQPVEVSTGYFADFEPTAGVFNGVAYTGITRNIRPDHLALLPDEVGACSWRDGCGTPRVNVENGDSMDEETQQLTAEERGLFRRFFAWLNQSRDEEPPATEPATNEREQEQSMAKQELVAALVANAACKFSREKLETWEEADLQALSESLTANGETQADPPPAQVALPPEMSQSDHSVITAFAAMIRSLGGVERLGAALGAITANADGERAELVSDLAANSAFTAEELAQMPVASLRKLRDSLAARDYSGGAGTFRVNFGADEEELAMPYQSANGAGGNNG